MQTESGKKIQIIAWNGVHLHIPFDWDARVCGQRHLIFEKDFQPQLQIRWEEPGPRNPQTLQARSRQFAARMGAVIAEADLPPELQHVKESFDLVTYYAGESGTVAGGVFLGKNCRVLVLFQLLYDQPSLLQEVCGCLTTLKCPNHPEILWRIQDFSLTLPVAYLLKDYTFGAGLTRLSFSSSDLSLQTCKLGPADTRLGQQSLVEILIALTDAPELEIVTENYGNSCGGYRNPTIPRQIFFRLRREKPFIRAKIWLDARHNRILAVVLSSNRPIPQTTIEKICRRYEIV